MSALPFCYYDDEILLYFLFYSNNSGLSCARHKRTCMMPTALRRLVHRAYISEIERAASYPTIVMVEKLVAALGDGAAELLKRAEEGNHPPGIGHGRAEVLRKVRQLGRLPPSLINQA